MISLPHTRRAALAALIVATLALGCKKTKPTESSGPNPSTPPATPSVPNGPAGPTGPTGPGNTGPSNSGPPAGWSEVRDPIGGFRVYVYGRNRALNMATAPAEKKQLQMTMYQNAFGFQEKAAQVTTHSLVPPADFKMGSSPDELYAALLLHQKGLMTFQDVLLKESVKLGGRPGLKVVTKANNFSPPPKLDDPETMKRLEEGYKKDIARRRTYFVTTTATRVIVILAQTEGDPEPAELKTITDSFAFL